MKNRFDLIIFDWDGTLADSVDWIVQCIQAAAQQYRCPVPQAQAVKNIIGLSIENAMLTLFAEQSDDMRQQLAAAYSQKFFSQPIGPEHLFPGVRAMLQQLKADGYRLAVATGKKSKGLALAIEQTGVADLFCITRSADQSASKPDPLMINQIVDECGADKQRTLMVGDSIHDLQMALNAGVSSVGVTCGAHSEAVLQAFNPIRCLAYPTDLIHYI
jgi:phosphoglycolate phosphatase